MLLDMSHTDTRQALAAEIRAAIARVGRKQNAIADATGISPASLSRKLRGETAFYAEEVVAIADAIGVDAGALLALAIPRATSLAS